jgi:molybdate transport system substrate-binding protein
MLRRPEAKCGSAWRSGTGASARPEWYSCRQCHKPTISAHCTPSLVCRPVKPRLPWMKRPHHLLACLLFTACAPAFAGTITVAVAANVQYAFDDLQAAFRKETGHELKPIYNSSGKFVAQVMNGAPFDVLLSADMEYPEKLHKEGYAAAAPKVYAYGALVLWTMKALDLKNWQTVLASPAVAKIAVANPKTAPYGRQTIKALDYFKLNDALKAKLVFGESIAQTNQYIHSKAADAGFTAKSVVMSPEMKGQGTWIELPKDSYQPIAQGAVILKHGQQTNPKLAQQFYDFLYSAKARAIFERYGYLLP